VLTRDLLRQLQAPEGARALEAAAAALEGERDFLRATQIVARRFPDRLARAAVEQVGLRYRAAAKFPAAAAMFFEREALEQATSEPVARHRARRFAGGSIVFDLGAGIGGDSLALARIAPVTAIERDPIRIALLQANAGAAGLIDRLRPIQADLLRLPLRFPAGALAFADPGRRAQGRRLRGVQRYEPPLRVVQGWLPALAGLAVKVSPAVKREELRGLDCEIEFVSLAGELKEATLWFGALRAGARRATVLPAGASIEGEVEADVPTGPLGRFLLEPDPAVLRAGLVRTVAAQLGAHPIAPEIAFLSQDEIRPSPFVRAYRVLDVAPFRQKSLQEMLVARGAGRVTIKRRGSAVEPEALARRLRLRGEGEATVVLTRIAGRQTMLLVEPVAADPASPEAHVAGAPPVL